MKEKLLRIGKYILVLCIMIAIGIGLLSLVNLISKDKIYSNVNASLWALNDEGYFPFSKGAYHVRLDNYTDAIMIDTAYSVDLSNPVESAFFMRRGYRPNANLEKDPEGVKSEPIYDLYRSIVEENTYYFTYARYWHGYMLYLRPLLVITDYQGIRMVLSTLIIALSICLLILTWKKISPYISLATLLFLICSNIWAIGLSMQYSSVFIIMLLASVSLLLFHKRIKDMGLFFLFLFGQT